MQYSPKLKKVIAEIKDIIKKNDVAAFVCLVEPGFAEYILVIDPSFSAASFDGSMIRVKTKGLPLSAAEKKKLSENTFNMFSLLSTVTMNCGLDLGKTSQALDKELNVKHGDTTHTSQTELDN